MTFSYLAVAMLCVGSFATSKQQLLCQIESDWAYFYLTNIAFSLVPNWIHSFILELIIASGCKFWGFGVCKAGYIG